MKKQVKSILLIEDERSIADNIIYALKTEGYSAHHCTNATQARAYLEKNCPDLILLDVGLPDENGFEYAKTLRSKVNTPIIFVTARSDEIDRILGLELGADDYVVKPFSPRELTARVGAVLRRTQAELPNNEDEYSYGKFVLNSQKWTLVYNNVPINLSRYEFLLFSILIKSPGRVFTREQLMNRAWDDPAMSMERTVDSHIKSIRNKLRQIDDACEYINTHRGVGYSFKESEDT